MVRSFANRSHEDSQIKERIFNPDIYNALKEGYLSEANEFLSPIEKESLDLSALTVSLIQCIRFLTDYYNLDDLFFQLHLIHNMEYSYHSFPYNKDN